MKTIHIDFAPTSAIRTVIQTRPATWLFGGIGIVLCAFISIRAATLVQEKNAREADLQLINAKSAQRTSQKPSAVSLSESHVNAVNGAIGQLNLPWRDVFDAIEAATPAAIAVLALEPDAKKHLLKGMAEAKSSDDMIAYIESLKQQAFFSAIVLTRHEINAQDPNKPIRFQFEANWNEVRQ
jgi:Tfp pilus assembly protein PilN